MIWVRSVPAEIPRGRSYVVDQLPKLVTVDYGTALAALVDLAPLVMVEWDIAFDPELMNRFEQAVAEQPQRVHVAPYRLWPVSTGLEKPVWAHRRQSKTSLQRYWVGPTDRVADWFSLGMVYLPAHVMRVAKTDGILTRNLSVGEKGYEGADDNFSTWHLRRFGPVPIVWSCKPVHLNWQKEESCQKTDSSVATLSGEISVKATGLRLRKSSA